MKSMKKIGAIFMAFVLAFSLCATAFAADDVIGNKDDTGTITVMGIDDAAAVQTDENGDVKDPLAQGSIVVTAYPIFLAYYDKNGDFAGYVSLYPDIVPSLDTIKTATVTFTVNGEEQSVVLGRNITSTSTTAVEEWLEEYNSEHGTTLTANDLTWSYTYEFTEDELAKIGNATRVSTLDNAKEILANYVGVEVGDLTYTFADGVADTLLADGAALTLDSNQDYAESQNALYSFSATVPLGSYYVHVSNSEAVEYGEAVVSTYYTNGENNELEIQPGNVNMISDGYAWMKAETPKVDKSITGVQTGEEDATEPTGGENGTSANIGDTIYYQVKVAEIPYMGGEHPYMTVTDTLSDGLTLNSTASTISVVVVIPAGEVEEYEKLGYTVDSYPDESTEPATTTYYIKLSAETDYTVTITGTGDGGTSMAGATLKIDFVVNEKYTLNDFEGKDMYINYNVTLNENATLNQYSNDNDVVLEYTTDSTIENGEHNTPEDRTHTYTYDIDGYLSGEGEYPGTPGWNESGSITRNVLTKVGDFHYVDDQGETVVEGTEGSHYTELLAGAEFKLYTDEDCKTEYSNDAFENPITTDINGRFAIYGLAAGTYYLQETKAPDGYTLNKTVYQIVIEETIDDNTGELQSWTISISVQNENGEWQSTGSSTFDLTNLAEDQTLSGTDIPETELNGNYEQNFTTEIEGKEYSFVYTGKGDAYNDAGEVIGTEYYYEGYSGAYNDDANGSSYTDASYQLTITVTDGGASVVWTLVQTATVSGTTALIRNTNTPELPNTGGIGTTLFYIIGALIILAAIVLFVTMRRRNNRRTAE